jgi:hypothetical protein
MTRVSMLFVVVLIAMLTLSSNSSNAQLPEGAFVVSASFSQEWDDAGLSYTFSKDFEAGLGIVFKNVSYSLSEGDSPDSETRTGFYAWGTYYLTKGKYANPYLAANIYYIADPSETNSNGEVNYSDMGAGISFGAQSFITDGLALWADIGVMYSSYKTTYKTNSGSESSHTKNIFQLLTSSVGASFYF